MSSDNAAPAGPERIVHSQWGRPVRPYQTETVPFLHGSRPAPQDDEINVL